MTRSPTKFPCDYAHGSGRPTAWRVTSGSAVPSASAQQLVAAWAAVLYQYTGESDLVFGIPDAVGFRVEPDATFTALIRQAEQLTAVQVDEPLVRFGVDVGLPGRGQLAVGVRRGVVRVGYDSGLLEEATAVRLEEHYVRVLELALKHPEIPVRDLRSASGPYDCWPVPPVTSGETLVGRFRAVAARYGDRPAVHGPSGEWTYRELDAASDALAARVRPVAGRGERVALLCGHDITVVCAVLAVLKAGAAYVPLDPQQPDIRLATILADVGPALILADADHLGVAERLAKGRPVQPVLDDGSAQPPLESEDAPDALAYILYTSGSTGAPKGIMQTNRNMLTHVLRFAHRLGLTAEDRVPMVARCTFDASLLDMFGALLTGASLHVIDPYLPPPADLLEELVRRQVTVLHCTPTLLRLFFAQLDSRPAAPDLRAVVLGGEEMTGADVAGVASHFAGAELINGFGPSECTVALHHRVESADTERASVPIGYPVEGIDVCLVDADGRPAALFGEVVLAGEGVALGYWDQPELTARAFGTRADGVRFYRTGDLARRRPDGKLVFCGRRDQQIKIRGYRVEPAEAEVTLRAHPTVRHAAVVAVPDGPLGPRLIGYVTSPGPLNAVPEELLGYLRRMLPDYAVPARIVVVPRLPVGPTGKLDRSLLPAPSEEEVDADDLPRTEWEQRLAALWCEVLARRTAGLRDHFFAGGGDSIRVMKLLARVNAECRVRVSMPAFLAEPTLGTLVRLVAASAWEPQPAPPRMSLATPAGPAR